MLKRIEEKRRYLRLNIPLEIEYILGDSDKVRKAVTKDISAFGIRFATTDRLETGSNLEVALKIPNVPNPVHASGKIAWSKKASAEGNSPFDVGIEFVKIEEDNKNTFLKYLCDLIYG
jgi:Tfp pilus assembly protein PilZ